MDPTLKRFSFQAMGSYCEIQIYDDSRVNAKRIVRKLTAEVSRLERKYSRFRNDNVVADINQSAGQPLGTRIDSETVALFSSRVLAWQSVGSASSV